MPEFACAVVIEQVDDGRYRATCHLLPDAEVFAETEEIARRIVEQTLERILQEQRPDSGTTRPTLVQS